MADTVHSRVANEQCATVAELHELVIAVLSSFGFKDVADSYAEYRYYKNNYAKTFEQLRQDADDVLRLGDRENANFDSALVSTKGSLIKGYLTKSLYKQFYLSKTEKELIERGDIYIHDLRDMILGSYNCLDGSSWVTVKINDEIRTLTLNDLREELQLDEGVFGLSRGIQVLSRNGWSSLNGISIRPLKEGEPIYNIKAKNGLAIRATENHRIPVITQEGKEEIKFVKDIVEKDSLIRSSESVEAVEGMIDLTDYADPDKTYVNNIKYVKKYFEYAYGGMSLQKYFKEVIGVHVSKNCYSVTLRNFLELKKRIQIPFDVYTKLSMGRLGSNAKVPLLLPVSEELARMFGYIFADGCVPKVNTKNGTYQIILSNTNKAILEDFQRCAEIVFPDVRQNYQVSGETNTTPCDSVRLCNAVVHDLFRKFKNGSYDIAIPDFIMNGTEDQKYGFIAAAYDCDGC